MVAFTHTPNELLMSIYSRATPSYTLRLRGTQQTILGKWCKKNKLFIFSTVCSSRARKLVQNGPPISLLTIWQFPKNIYFEENLSSAPEGWYQSAVYILSNNKALVLWMEIDSSYWLLSTFSRWTIFFYGTEPDRSGSNLALALEMMYVSTLNFKDEK